MDLKRLDNETDFEWKLRCCKAKINKETDLDWAEIVSLLGLDVSADHLRKTAYGLIEYDDYIHGFGGVATTILSLSDLHVPFHRDFEEILADYVGKVDILQLNGDILDCAGCSKFPKFFRQSPVEEMIVARNYLIDLIKYIKPKKVVATYGNHELRLGQFLANKLENDIQELMPMTALDYIFTDGFTHYDRKAGTKTKYEPLIDVFPEIEIEYNGEWYCQIGDCVFAHPKSFSSAPLKTAEKAMYWFRNEGFTFKSLVMAHTHRQGQYKIGNTTIFEQGAFCYTDKMKYNDGLLINSQKEGFIIICQDKDGNTIDDKTRLVSLN